MRIKRTEILTELADYLTVGEEDLEKAVVQSYNNLEDAWPNDTGLICEYVEEAELYHMTFGIFATLGLIEEKQVVNKVACLIENLELI